MTKNRALGILLAHTVKPFPDSPDNKHLLLRAILTLTPADATLRNTTRQLLMHVESIQKLQQELPLAFSKEASGEGREVSGNGKGEGVQ
jgi:hypothetical protein